MMIIPSFNNKDYLRKNNILSKNHAVTSIDSTGHGTDRHVMQYDAVGNMIYQADNAEGKRKNMSYDSSNRIVNVTNPDTGVAVGKYWYDDQGFRVRKVARETTGGQTIDTEVLYPSMYFGLEKKRYAGGGDVENSHCAVNNVYLNGVRTAAVLPSGKAFYYLTDQVDSVKVVVNDSGMPVSRMEYLPFGDTWFQEGDTSHNPKYNSQELDKETGYYFYNARHYDAGIGRFVTPDTVIDGEMSTQGWNRYAYCKNNPIKYSDPTGHAVVDNNGMGGLGSLWNSVKETANNAASTAKEFVTDHPGERLGNILHGNGNKTEKEYISDLYAGKIKPTKGPLDRLGETAHKNPGKALAVGLTGGISIAAAPIAVATAPAWGPTVLSATKAAVTSEASKLGLANAAVQTGSYLFNEENPNLKDGLKVAGAGYATGAISSKVGNAKSLAYKALGLVFAGGLGDLGGQALVNESFENLNYEKAAGSGIINLVTGGATSSSSLSTFEKIVTTIGSSLPWTTGNDALFKETNK